MQQFAALDFRTLLVDALIFPHRGRNASRRGLNLGKLWLEFRPFEDSVSSFELRLRFMDYVQFVIIMDMDGMKYRHRHG